MLKQKLCGSVLVCFGYLLSPLSWWNDLLLNIPLAYLFASVFSVISPRLFAPMIVLGYWLTNIIGLILMHTGAKKFFFKIQKPYSRGDLIKDLLFSVLYSLIMVALIMLGWLKAPSFILGINNE